MLAFFLCERFKRPCRNGVDLFNSPVSVWRSGTLEIKKGPPKRAL